MNNSDEFPGIGKKLPYSEPDGFFSGLSEKTLKEAKLREQNRRRITILWRSVAVAASISALAFLGYFMFEPDLKKSHQIVQEKTLLEQPIISEPEIVKETEVVAEYKKVVSEEVTEAVVINEEKSEEIGDVLADLSDEELSQFAAMYKTDPFLSESDQ